MRKAVVALLAVVVITLFPTPAHAAEGCILSIQGIKVCGTLLNQPLPEVVTVTVPPVTLPPKTITVPGPTRTVYVPQDAKTVYRPGESQTVYSYRLVPAPTKTVTASPVGKTPEAVPTATATTTVTETPKTVVKRVYVKPKEEPGSVISSPPFSLNAPEAVGYSALALLGACGLVVLGMWLAYMLGYKDSDRKNKRFLAYLRDSFYTKGKHQ